MTVLTDVSMTFNFQHRDDSDETLDYIRDVMVQTLDSLDVELRNEIFAVLNTTTVDDSPAGYTSMRSLCNQCAETEPQQTQTNGYTRYVVSRNPAVSSNYTRYSF